MRFFTKIVHAGMYLALSCVLVACLGGGGSTTPPVTPTLALLAGNVGGSGSNDGPLATAHFSNPSGVAIDSAGNIYVTQLGFNSVRKITPTGLVSTLAGTSNVSGSTDGNGTAASFNTPTGIAADSAGNVYVLDSGNFTIRKITSTGEVSTLAGTPGVRGSADGSGAEASFYYSSGIAADSTGNVYVADSGNNTIRKITQTGMVSTLAGTSGIVGSTDGTGAAASFNNPTGIAADSAGNVYVADYGNNTIRKVTPTGAVSTLAGTPGIYGNADGSGAAASFFFLSGIATDSAGNIYVADTGNINIRKITSTGVVTTLAGMPGIPGNTDGTGLAASFFILAGIAADSAGNIYVADTGNSSIRKITPAGVVSTMVGASVVGSSDGSGAEASFRNPSGVAADSAGNAYIADTGNNTIRKVTPAGQVSTLAGMPGVLGSSDGAGAAANFNHPTGIATDSAGNVYIADSGNSAIRKIAPDGVVSTLAGKSGMIGSDDGSGADARFNYPSAVAADGAGNVYVADQGNNVIRKIAPDGVVSTLAGTHGEMGSQNGAGAAASFYFPSGIATDSAGNVYVADSGNNPYPSWVFPPPFIQQSTIRKITPAGVVTTLAGIPGVIGSADGIAALASFNYPTGLATDSAGNVYVADTGNHTIRKITPTGVVSTVVGVAGVVGFTPGVLPGVLSSPRGVAISGTSLYITTYNGVAVVNNVP
jgi:sugar lactone lactonase YvrE